MIIPPIPYGTTRRLSQVPYATYTLIGINILVWVVSVFVFFGSEIEDLHAFLTWGALTPARLHWHTLITSAFLHESPLPLHLAGNMLFLFVFGQHVEDALGRGMFVAAYLGSHLAAMLMHMLVGYRFVPHDMELPTLGASGAIAGVLGLFAVRFYNTHIKVFYLFSLFGLIGRAGTFLIRAVWGLGFYFLWDVVQGLLDLGYLEEGGGVASWAHVGGFLFGLAIALVSGLREEAVGMYTASDAYDWFRDGQWRKAAVCFEEIVHDEPENADAHLKLGVCHELTGRPRQGLASLATAQRLYREGGDVPAATAALVQVIRYHPATSQLEPETYLEAAELLETQTDLPLAAAAYEQLARAHPQHPLAEHGVVQAGQLYLGPLNRPDEAARLFSIITRQRPGSPYAAQAAEGLRQAQWQLGMARSGHVS